MRHALIIDQNMLTCRIIREHLRMLGFDSFDRSVTEHEAVEAATIRRPDLVVIGSALVSGSPVSAARRISANGGIPVLLASGNRSAASHQLAEAGSYVGPFPIDEFATAIAVASVPH